LGRPPQRREAQIGPAHQACRSAGNGVPVRRQALASGKEGFALIKPDASTHIDEIVERLEPEVSSSEIFAALFELELSGKVRQLPGKNFVRCF
jgi:predicted Rossmann fold nucleotide-binding protein DprA/Smf involved in DNA uptake